MKILLEMDEVKLDIFLRMRSKSIMVLTLDNRIDDCLDDQDDDDAHGAQMNIYCQECP